MLKHQNNIVLLSAPLRVKKKKYKNPKTKTFKKKIATQSKEQRKRKLLTFFASPAKKEWRSKSLWTIGRTARKK